MDLEVLKGEVTSLRVYGDKFFGIAKVRRASSPEATVVGQMLGVSVGDGISARGEWTTHPKFGEQFKAKSVEVVVPEDVAGVTAWIASRCPNVGLARAREIVVKFGVPGTWDVIEREPRRLCEIKGITEERADEIAKAYARHRGERDRMVFFKRFGLTDYQVAQVLAAWGDKAEEHLRSNPYDLAEEVDGFGFTKADVVAMRMGVPKDSPSRIQCGAMHVLGQAATMGHVYVPRGKLVAMTAELLELDGDDVAREIALMERQSARKIVARDKAIYLARFERAEGRVADRLRAMAERKAA